MQPYEALRFYMLLTLGKTEGLELGGGNTKNEKKFASFGQ